MPCGELTHRPLFLFNMAECARALGDTANARELYERYLAADGNGAFAATARARVTELPAPPPPAPAPTAAPSPATTVTPEPTPAIPAPADVAAAHSAKPEAVTTTVPPAERSHLRRNALLVGLGLAVVAGSVAVYAATRGPECGTGCIDLR